MGAFEQMLARASLDDEYSWRDVVHNALGLFLAVRAVYQGELDLSDLTTKYGKLIDEVAKLPPPVPRNSSPRGPRSRMAPARLNTPADETTTGHVDAPMNVGGCMSTELTTAILAMDEDGALKIVKDRLDGGEAPEAVLDDARSAMTTLGEKFACEEVFIPELIMGGEIMKGIAAELTPRIAAADEAEKRGTVVIGTVHGDIHDIGKDVVVMMLEVSGYDVHDLGIDVPGRELRRRDQGAVAGGRRPLRSAHARLRLDEGHHPGHRRCRPARPRQDHDRRKPRRRADLHLYRRRRLGPRRCGRPRPRRRVDGRCGMTPAPEELYAQREQRFNDIVALRKPDKIPVMPLMMHYFPNKIAGVSNAAVEADHFLRTKLMKEATLKFGFEWAAAVGVPPAKSCEALQLKQMRWPGGDLPDDAPFQWVEGEYIKADEVDQFLADPNGFAMRTILPRIAGIFQPLSFIQFPPMYWLANAYSTILLAPFLSAPGMKEMFEGMAAFCEDAQNFMAAEGGYFGEMAAMGYPRPFVGVGFPAFDLVSDYFRSLRGSTLDMFRQPDKLLAMIDAMVPPSINLIIGACKATNTTRAFIPMHRGAGGFMSDEQFEKFYWPCVQRAHLRLHRERHHADAALRGRLHAAPEVPRHASARQGRGALRQDRSPGVQGDVRRRHVLLGQRTAVAPGYGHSPAGQGRCQGAHRHHGRPAHHRQHGRHPRRIQAREHHGPQGSGRRVWRPLR